MHTLFPILHLVSSKRDWGRTNQEVNRKRKNMRRRMERNLRPRPPSPSWHPGRACCITNEVKNRWKLKSWSCFKGTASHLSYLGEARQHGNIRSTWENTLPHSSRASANRPIIGRKASKRTLARDHLPTLSWSPTWNKRKGCHEIPRRHALFS